MDRLKIGSRKSQLAMAQTRIVVEKLRRLRPELNIEIVPMTTEGDRRLDKNLSSFGGKGVFTRELERALLEGEIHMAVHSAKDMPIQFDSGLTLGAVVERAETEDVLVTRSGLLLEQMPENYCIGTGSLRRGLQIRRWNPGLVTKDIRGNVQTRLRKLLEGEYDGIVLARAGLERLRRDSEEEFRTLAEQFHYETLEWTVCLPAAGQGILAVEVSEEGLRSKELAEICQLLNDAEAQAMLQAERSFLKVIGGGCNAPAGACSEIEGERLIMRGCFSSDGKTMYYGRIEGRSEESEKLGAQLAEKLLRDDRS